jgi:hypothetical protein
MHHNFMKRLFVLLILCSFGAQLAHAQMQKRDDERSSKGKNTGVIPSVQAIQDRGTTTHDRSNIGMFIENRGKLYARSNAIGVSGEYPINSEQEYIYQLNPLVLFPGYVIQSRNTQNEEWEAEFGYSNREQVRIATSTDEETWPESGWPIKNAQGENVFVSDQDTYAAFNDSLSREQPVRQISVYQTGYSFSFPLVRDAVVYTYEVVNHSDQTYTDMYFGMYSDFDIGNTPGADPEYEDDIIGYDEDIDLLYFYDDGETADWPGGTTGHFGLTYISTPEKNGQEPGLTDWHYNLWQDTPLWDDNDDFLYGVFTGDYDLVPQENHAQFFHPVEEGRRKDDPGTIPPQGSDLTANSASGPYDIAPGDTLTFVIAVVAGQDYEGIRATAENVHQAYRNNWELPSAPPRPELTAYTEKDRVVLTWDNRSEIEPDPFSKEFDFEGYKIYRSIDFGQTWDQIDRNVQPDVGGDPVPIASFSKTEDNLAYHFVDDDIDEGFTYWYSITALDTGLDDLGQLESSIGTTTDLQNVVEVTPLPNASNWQASTARVADHPEGNSTDTLLTRVFSVFDTEEKSYDVTFSRMAVPDQGNLLTTVETNPLDPGLTLPTIYEVSWNSATEFSIRNVNAGRNRLRDAQYSPGQTYTIAQDNIEFTFFENDEDPEFQPQSGDVLLIVPSFMVTDDEGITVLEKRPLERNLEFITSDGVGITFQQHPFIISEVPSALTISVQNATYSALSDDEFRFEITEYLEQDESLEITWLDNRDRETVDTVAVGDLLTISNFDLLLEKSEDVTWVQLVGTSFSVKTSEARFPTEADRYTFSKTSGQVDESTDKSKLERINVVPNPYVVYNKWERDISLERREPERLIRFRNLPNTCTIHIFTMAGEKVKSLRKSDTSGVIGWDLRTEGGREIAPGVYIYKVETEIGTHVDRFSVIK